MANNETSIARWEREAQTNALLPRFSDSVPVSVFRAVEVDGTIAVYWNHQHGTFHLYRLENGQFEMIGMGGIPNVYRTMGDVLMHFIGQSSEWGIHWYPDQVFPICYDLRSSLPNGITYAEHREHGTVR